MDLGLRSKLKALPIWNAADFSLRSMIADLTMSSERSETDLRAFEAALDELSDARLERHSHPQTIPSKSQTVAFLAEKVAQSSQYHWKKQGSCLLLISRSKTAEARNVPGVAFEFVIRTGRSAWTVYRIPDPGEILGCAVYLERNELIAQSQRPSKSPIRAMQSKPHRRLAGLGRAVATALRPLPVRQASIRQRKKSDGVAVSGAVP
ncbi:MAG: hypothetical protein ACYTE3_03350 [Planctomycetota bacterium]|jgi:hypothetical protein